MTVFSLNKLVDSTSAYTGKRDEVIGKSHVRGAENEQTLIFTEHHQEVSVSLAHVLFADTKVPLTAKTVGGKAANLQKLWKIGEIETPKWFVLPTEVFKQYLVDNRIVELIEQLDILCTDLEYNSNEISQLAEKIKEAIVKGNMSSAAFLEINTAYEQLKKSIGRNDVPFAVRSSGVIEDDIVSSCAGLYDTFLNCKGIEEVIKAVKDVWASSFNLRVVQERVRLGVKQSDCLIGVIVQELIDAQASGVAATLVLSNNYPGIQVAANYGVGESVVSGEVTVDGWIIHPTKGYILEAVKGKKEICYVLDAAGGTKKVEVSTPHRDLFVLNSGEVHELARQVARIKAHYQCDVDVEFAVNQEGKLFILQARPLIAVKSEKVFVIDSEDAKRHQSIAQGLYSVPGTASGRLVFINSLEELATGKIKLTKDDIALAYVTTNVWSQYLTNIKGLITREGSPSSHPILLCREKKIPCVIGIHYAFEELIKRNGTIVTIDAFNKILYEGVVANKEASSADLLRQFEPVKMREWPNVERDLPHLLHNKMVVQHEEKYWRRTPTYPLVGFQLELNMQRFAVVPKLLKKEGEVAILAKVIDGYTCNELVPFENYVALFNGFTTKEAAFFNQAQAECMQDFIKLAENFTFDADYWHKYIDTYARFRAFIWLGGGYRSYAERRVDEIGIAVELPALYLDECSHAIQAAIPEIDTAMARDVRELAESIRHKVLPENVAELETHEPVIFAELEKLSKKYRFEHTISLDTPINLNTVYKRIKQEVEAIQSGAVFASSKTTNSDRALLPEAPELLEWLRLSIWNRILQSDAHHLDARAKALVQPKLLELGRLLIERGKLDKAEKIFACTVGEIADYMKMIHN